MVSFHNDKRLKDELLQLLTAYQFNNKIGCKWECDTTEMGSGFECVLECETEKPFDYSYFEARYGIPASVAELEADLFYCLDTQHQQEWPALFVDALPVGIDLNGVIPGLIEKIWFKKRLGILSLCPPDKKHVFIPMKNRLIGMQLHHGNNRQGRPTLFNWEDLPEWQTLDDEDNKGDVTLRKLLIGTYGTVRYVQWHLQKGASLLSLLVNATQLFEYVARQNARRKVFFNRELYEKEGFPGINRQCDIEGNLAEKQIKIIVQHLYAYDLLDVLKQQ